MKENEYQDGIRELAFYFFAAPVVILVGMAGVGAIIDSFLHTSDTFSKLFVYIGGIGGIATYYSKLFFQFKEQAKLKIRNIELSSK
jgi:hypothetical protein